MMILNCPEQLPVLGVSAVSVLSRQSARPRRCFQWEKTEYTLCELVSGQTSSLPTSSSVGGGHAQ